MEKTITYTILLLSLIITQFTQTSAYASDAHSYSEDSYSKLRSSVLNVLDEFLIAINVDCAEYKKFKDVDYVRGVVEFDVWYLALNKLKYDGTNLVSRYYDQKYLFLDHFDMLLNRVDYLIGNKGLSQDSELSARNSTAILELMVLISEIIKQVEMR